jgi:hypothetical protein
MRHRNYDRFRQCFPTGRSHDNQRDLGTRCIVIPSFEMPLVSPCFGHSQMASLRPRLIGIGGLKMVESDPVLKSQNADEILRSVQDWMIQQAHAARPANQTANINKSSPPKESPLSPSFAPPEHSIESVESASPERPIHTSPQANISPATSNELFAKKRLAQTILGGFLIAFVVGVVWQTYRDNQTRNLIEAWERSSVVWLRSFFSATPRESRTSAQSSTKLSDQAAQKQTGTSLQTDEVAELKQQVLSLVNDLAVIRRDVEQLSGKQEQLSREIATVQATEQNVSEKISSLTQPAPTLTQPAPTLARPAAPAHGQARKNVPRVVHAETPKQPDAASLPATTSSTGTVSLTEQPPRPPLPVPTAAETPSPLH